MASFNIYGRNKKGFVEVGQNFPTLSEAYEGKERLKKRGLKVSRVSRRR